MCETCCGPKDLTHATPAYRRALILVVVLNLGMGVGEAIAGIYADSQALRADALDFLGDGLITLLGLLALRWGARWRSRAALLQGVFLGALGLGVMGMAVYRAYAQQMPEAGVMSAIGFVALLVNVAAALVLMPHRAGDANVRAVWLFSRNDAVGNAAVVAAGGLVAVTGTVWPDLVVAIAIAALFLHSSLEIVRGSFVELLPGGDGVPDAAT